MNRVRLPPAQWNRGRAPSHRFGFTAGSGPAGFEDATVTLYSSISPLSPSYGHSLDKTGQRAGGWSNLTDDRPDTFG
jgi:hypothetical protein